MLKGEKNINNEDIDSITVKAIKYSINKTKKKYISIALIIIICLTFFTLLGSYLYNYNKLTDHLINTCQNDTCVYGLILTNSRKNIIFIKNIEFNNEYVGTIDDIFTDTVTVSLISNNNVIMRYTTEHDQKVSLSEMLNNVYFYIDTSYEEYKNLNIDLANLTLTIECNDINLIVDISI